MATTGNEKKIFYGWIVTFISFLTLMVSTAGRQSIIIFFPTLIGEFGWSRAALSLAPSILGITGSLCSLLIGFLSEKWNIKKILLGGTLLAACGLYLCHTIDHIWQFYLFFGILTGFGVYAVGMLPNTIIVSNWFMRKRGTAIGIITSGFGAGTLLFFPLLQIVISQYGWRTAYICLAVLIGPVLFTLILLFQRVHPAEMGLTEDGAQPESGHRGTVGEHRAYRSSGEPGTVKTSGADESPDTAPDTGRMGGLRVLLRAFGSRRFWFTYVQFILGPLSTAPVTIHQAAFFRDTGLDSITTAMIVGLYGFSVFLGMLASGYISDTLSREKSYTLGTVLLVIGCFFLILSTLRLGLIPPLLYSLFFGLGFGTRPSMDAATATDIFKGKHFGVIYGFLSSGLGVGQLIGPVLGGIIHDQTGSYMGAFVFCMVAVTVATACIWAAAPRRGRERLFDD